MAATHVDTLLTSKVGFLIGPCELFTKFSPDHPEAYNIRRTISQRKVDKQTLLDSSSVNDNEIIERCMLALVNECFKLLEESGGLVSPEMIDFLFVRIYGFPRHLGGIM